MRQYISASESPFLTTSSVVSSMNHQNNIDAPLFPPFSLPSSSSPSSFVQYTSTGNGMNNIGNNAPRLVTCSSVPPPSTSTITAAVTNLNDMQEIYKPPSTNSNEAVIQEFPLPLSNVYSTEDTNRNLTPINEYNNISTTPIPIPTKKKVSRPPTSSSGSSATVGHDVTHSQSRFVNNNSDKPPGTLLQTVSSESSAFNQNNNNNRMDSLTEMLQTEIKKMALNEDLIELKRTVDRMQQQRVSDLEDHLTRVAEQKLREKEILEQIKLTKQKLDMAIAERMFTNNNKEEEEANQRLPMQPADVNVPLMKSSNSTNTIRSNKLKSSASVSGGAASDSGNNNSSRYNQQQQQQQQQPTTNRQRNRRSFPSAYQRLPAQNEYFPDMSKPNFDFSYPSQYGYPQDYNPEIDMMRMMNGSQNHFADPFGMDSPGLRYSRRKASLQRRPRSKSMESQWQEQQELENQYMQQHHQHPDMYQDGDLYYPTPRTRSRKSSLRSAKSSSSDSDNNNNKKSDFHDNFDQPATTNEEEKRSTSGRQPEMGSDEDRHHSARHRNGSGRFRRGHPHPGNMGNMPPNMFGYPNGPPPLPHPMDRERMKMRPPPPPPHYGYNNMPPPPPPGNEYFSYMPPSQRISPRMMAALAADEQNQQQQQQPYGGYQWGQGMYGMPPPPPPDNASTGANLTCEQQDQPAFGVRRFPPPPPSATGGQQQSASLQQTPQPPPPPQGYFNVW